MRSKLSAMTARVIRAHRDEGGSIEFEVSARIETPQEVLYLRHGGILQYVLRQLLGEWSEVSAAPTPKPHPLRPDGEQDGTVDEGSIQSFPESDPASYTGERPTAGIDHVRRCQRRNLAMAINGSSRAELGRQSADFIVERYDADVVFVPMEKSDVQHSHAVVANMKNAERAEILRRRYSPRQILDVMGRFEFAVGMRLHFLIFAALRGTPFAALPYASKVMGLLEDLGMDTPPLGSIGIGQLIARIDLAWDTRADIRAKISRRVPALKIRAEQTHALLLSLLERRSLATTEEAARS